MTRDTPEVGTPLTRAIEEAKSEFRKSLADWMIPTADSFLESFAEKIHTLGIQEGADSAVDYILARGRFTEETVANSFTGEPEHGSYVEAYAGVLEQARVAYKEKQ